MTAKIGRFNAATGEFSDTYHGAFCDFETAAAILATEAFGGTVAGGFAVPAFTASTAIGVGGGASAIGLGLVSDVGFVPAGGGFGGLLGSAFADIGVKDLISGGFSLLSAGSSGRAGELAAASLEQQAAFADIQSRQELLKGRKEALDIEALTLDEIAEFQAGVGARGITGSGSARAAQEAAITASNRQQDFASENAKIRAATQRITGRSLRIDAAAERVTGVLGAGKTLAEFAIKKVGQG